ncbi:ATP-binding protein [Vibrio penaeicida]|uniref:ATP-binding protein n=1 Tax=Vibrio penaeicida TaxID=104609 RepID=UPI000CEA4DB2|nr:DUF3404 domain-containing protein [Vibrio penaeicida]
MTHNLFSLRTIRLVVSVLILPLSLVTQAADNSNLQTRWQIFFQQALSLPYETKITLEELNRYPTQLLLSDNKYPDFKTFSWDDLQALLQLHQTCKLPVKLSDIDNEKRPKLTRAIQFEQALCSGMILNDDWYGQGEMLHPAGGSYADRYLASLPSEKQDLFITNHARELTLSNPSHPLHVQLSSLSDQGNDLLLSGYRAYLGQDGKLWLNGEFGLLVIAGEKWRKLLKTIAINIETQNGTEQVCAVSYSNLCIQLPPTENNAVKWLIVILTLLSVSFLSMGLINRREEAKERRFILQLLTHELRTPIASLGFTVEQFRGQFDQWDENAQRTFGRLLADHQRLSQLTETSKGFLSVDPKAQFQNQTAYLSDWLEHYLDKYKLEYQLDHDQELTLPYYWLGICLDNLLRNAQQHGEGDISINVSTGQHLRIEVSDQGCFPSKYQLLIKRIMPNTHRDNMGMGLAIVTRLMTKMGGRLICYRSPTRCILELPL